MASPRPTPTPWIGIGPSLNRLGPLGVWQAPTGAFESLLRCVLLSEASTDYLAAVPPLWVRDPGWRADARALLQEQRGLNDSQRRRARGAGGRRRGGRGGVWV